MKSLFNMIMGRGELQKDEESYKKQWNIVSPAMDAAGEGAKGFTCLQNLIAIMHWTSKQVQMKEPQQRLLSTQHSEPWKWSHQLPEENIFPLLWCGKANPLSARI